MTQASATAIPNSGYHNTFTIIQGTGTQVKFRVDQTRNAVTLMGFSTSSALGCRRLLADGSRPELTCGTKSRRHMKVRLLSMLVVAVFAARPAPLRRPPASRSVLCAATTSLYSGRARGCRDGDQQHHQQAQGASRSEFVATSIPSFRAKASRATAPGGGPTAMSCEEGRLLAPKESCHGSSL